MAKYLRTAVVVAIVGGIIWFCGSALFPDRGRDGNIRLVVYGFSVIGEPLRAEIFPAFSERWRREKGEEVEFLESFAASGVIANQIVNGTPADIAIFSHPGDADRLAKAGRATRDWRAGPHGGIVNRTPFVILVRPGNPKKITSYASLGSNDVKIVHPDPLTSGGAQWAILAEYAEPLVLARAERHEPSPEIAYEQLVSIWRNVTAQAPSARAAKTQFDQGFGDALVTYEVEALLDLAKGDKVEIVVPPATILSEHPVVLIDKNIRPAKLEVAEAFYEYLFTEEAQRVFVKYGFRSILPELDAANPRFARIAHLFTVADLGGWERARTEVVEGIWKARALAEAQRR